MNPTWIEVNFDPSTYGHKEAGDAVAAQLGGEKHEFTPLCLTDVSNSPSSWIQV